MAAPTYVGGTVASGLGAVTPSMPLGATTNDLLILVIESEGTAGTPSAPSGGAWTLIDSSASRTEATRASTCCTVYWATYDAALNRTVPDAGDHTAVSLTAWRDVELSAPINAQSSTPESTPASSHSSGGVTTTQADTMILIAATHGASVSFSGWVNANLTDLTQRIGWGHALGSDGAQTLFSGELPSAGGSGFTTWNTSPGSVEMGSVTFALAPLGFGYLDTYSDVYGEPGQQLTTSIEGSATVTSALTNLGFSAALQGTATVGAALTATAKVTDLTAGISGTGTVTSATVAVASIQVTALELTGVYTSSGTHNLVADIQGSATVRYQPATAGLSAALSGRASVTTAAPKLSQSPSVDIEGTATVTATSVVAASIQITALEISGQYTSTGAHNLVADLQGTGTVTTILENVSSGFVAALDGRATVTATLYTTQLLTTSLTGTATVTAAFAALRDLTATLTGTATFAATPLIEYVNQLQAAITGTATLTGSLEVPTVTFVPLLMGI